MLVDPGYLATAAQILIEPGDGGRMKGNEATLPEFRLTDEQAVGRYVVHLHGESF